MDAKMRYMTLAKAKTAVTVGFLAWLTWGFFVKMKRPNLIEPTVLLAFVVFMLLIALAEMYANWKRGG